MRIVRRDHVTGRGGGELGHSSIPCPSHCTSLIRFLSLSTSINPLLESLGLTVCEDFVNNVVTAHLAQPHQAASCRSALVRQDRKKGTEISTITALTAPTIYLSPHQFFSIEKHVVHRNFSLALSSALRPTGPRTASCRSSFVWLAYEFSASGMQHPQQVQFFPDPSLPPGQRDLEALERLKEIIKSNQHEIFRAIPQPAALASLYGGSLPSAVPSHPEQVPNNPKEKPTTAPSSPTFETPSSSTYISDAHRAHVVAAVQGVAKPSISNDTVRAYHAYVVVTH